MQPRAAHISHTAHTTMHLTTHVLQPNRDKTVIVLHTVTTIYDGGLVLYFL